MQTCKIERCPTDTKDPLDKYIIVTPWDSHSSHSKCPSGCSSCARRPLQGHTCISDRLSWQKYPYSFCPGGSRIYLYLYLHAHHVDGSTAALQWGNTTLFSGTTDAHLAKGGWKATHRKGCRMECSSENIV